MKTMFKPEYINIPLPAGILAVDEAMDWLEDTKFIEEEKDKLGFKYSKVHSFNISFKGHPQAVISLHLMYSDG